MRILSAFFVSKLKLKLYPSVEKVFIVDELDITDVLLLLLLRILWLGHWNCFVRFCVIYQRVLGGPSSPKKGLLMVEWEPVVDVEPAELAESR